MATPFTTAEFLDVFGRYNQGVWPAQVLMYLLGGLIVWLAWRPRARSGTLISAVLAFFWGWMALPYDAAYFSRINPAAWPFAAVFLLQAALLLHAGVRGGLSFRLRMDLAGIAGIVLVAYALAVYPLIGYAAGQRCRDRWPLDRRTGTLRNAKTTWPRSRHRSRVSLRSRGRMGASPFHGGRAGPHRVPLFRRSRRIRRRSV